MTSQQEVSSTCLFQITEKLEQNCCCNEGKNEPVCFYGNFKAENVQLSQVEKYFFFHLAPVPRFTKRCSVHSQSYVWILLGHSVPFYDKNGRSVLCVLTNIPLVTRIRSSFTLRWLPSKKCQAVCHFQKTQILDKICCKEEKKWTSVFLWQF